MLLIVVFPLLVVGILGSAWILAWLFRQSAGIKALALGIVLVLGLLANWPTPPKEKSVNNLIDQFEGNARYWDPDGQPYGSNWYRNDKWLCRIYAAEQLGEMGAAARAAVPSLLEALANGPNDFDTGDGILPYRSAIATALGKIGDERAIPVLIEKLETKEFATRSKHLTGPHQGRDGIGQPAVVRALIMFGEKARPALPSLIALEENPSGALWADGIDRVMVKRIRDAATDN